MFLQSNRSILRKTDFYHVYTFLISDYPRPSLSRFVEIIGTMQGKIFSTNNFAVPENIISASYDATLPTSFCKDISTLNGIQSHSSKNSPTLYTARLPNVLDWLHGQEIPLPLENQPCGVPLLLYDNELSTKNLLFHYDGTPASAQLIRSFLSQFAHLIKDSKSIIISPSFIARSKQREEQEVIQCVRNATAETSFIKFNFNRIGDFWSYAVKHQCTLLVTSKNYQADLAKVLFHFYKGGMWYDKLSFYLAF